MKKRNKQTSFQSSKHLLLQDSASIHFVHMLTSKQLSAIKHLPDRENSTRIFFKRCVILLLALRKLPEQTVNNILSMLESLPKSNWTICLDKLKFCDHTLVTDMTHLLLFKTLLQESILKEKDFKPFWTPVYKVISEQLSALIEIDCVDSGLNSSNILLKKPVVNSSSLMINETKVPSKNFPKICYQLSTSTVADKWENESTNTTSLHAIKLRIYPTNYQKQIFEEWFHTCNFIYNKTVEQINVHHHRINFQSLRDKIVTNVTRKTNPRYSEISTEMKFINDEITEVLDIINVTSESHLQLIESRRNEHKLTLQTLKLEQNALEKTSNPDIQEWELRTPKEIRANTVNDVCKAFKTGFTNLARGNIQHFHLGFRKKCDSKSIPIQPNQLRLDDGSFVIMPQHFPGHHSKLIMGKRTRRKLKKTWPYIKIDSTVRLAKEANKYYIFVPHEQDYVIQEEKEHTTSYCGIDPGTRQFMNVFSNESMIEYKQNTPLLRKLNAKIKMLKRGRTRPIQQYNKPGRTRARTGYRKSKMKKREDKKKNIVDEVHWKTINDMLQRFDALFYGDFKSHGIIQKTKNPYLKQDLTDLRFYVFKQRLMYKATTKGCRVLSVHEANTTKTCSTCGTIHSPGTSEIYICNTCGTSRGRDYNAAKNILMKGLVKILD